MCKGTKGENQEPSLAVAPVEVQPAKDENGEKEKCMAEYPAVTKDVPEEDPADGFINDVRKK